MTDADIVKGTTSELAAAAKDAVAATVDTIATMKEALIAAQERIDELENMLIGSLEVILDEDGSGNPKDVPTDARKFYDEKQVEYVAHKALVIKQALAKLTDEEKHMLGVDR